MWLTIVPHCSLAYRGIPSLGRAEGIPHGGLAPTYRRPHRTPTLGGAHAYGARRAATAHGATIRASGRSLTMCAQGKNTSAATNTSAGGQTYEWSAERDVAPADKLWKFKRAAQRSNFLGIRTRESVPDPAGRLRPLVQVLVLSALGLALSVSLFFAFSRDLVPQAYVEPAATTAAESEMANSIVDD
jgi:hypothetical protein